MNKIAMASQTKPYELLKKKVKLPKDYDKLRMYASIILKNHPSYSKEDIEIMFKDLSKSGCTYATYTNVIIEQLMKKDPTLFLEEFQNLFGYSLYDEKEKALDYNRLLVDLYSSLYNIGECSAVLYNRYSFKTIKEAVIKLGLISENDNYSELEMINIMNDNGYVADGLDSNKNLLFKDIKRPIKYKVVGTYQDLASKIFNNDLSDLSDDDIKELFNKNNIEVSIASLENYKKLSGLMTSKISFWINEFFKMKKIDFKIDINDFNGNNQDINEFINKLNDALSNGYSISVSSNPNSEIYMKNLNEKILPWTKLNGDKTGHAMFLKGISSTNDLIVSSWGNDYLIPISYVGNLEFHQILVTNNNYELDNQNKTI